MIGKADEMAKNLNKFSFLTPVSFACYFVMSAMLAPMGILTPEMAKYFQLPITEVARTFGALTVSNLVGAACATVALTVFAIYSHFDLCRTRNIPAITRVD